MQEYQTIRIPTQLLHKAHLDGESLAFELCDQGVLIKRSTHPRAGWEKYYAASSQENLWDGLDHEFSEDDWQWET